MAENIKAPHAETVKEFWLLRRFLRQRSVPSELKFRIINYSEMQAKKEVEMIPEAQVRLLSFLSEQLVSELHFNQLYSRLFVHPLLHRLEGRSHTLQELTTSVLSKHVFGPGDRVCSQEEDAKHMFFVTVGTMLYVKKGVETRIEETLTATDWVCEAALWTPWAYQGTTQAIDECELIYIDSDGFGKVIEEQPSLWAFFAQYAMEFVLCLNKVRKEDLVDCHVRAEAKREVSRLINIVAGGQREEREADRPNERKNWSQKVSQRLSGWIRR